MVRSLAWTALAMLLGWKLLSLYLGAGLTGVLAGQRFTQTATDRFPAFFRLSVWSLIFYAMAVLVGLMGLKVADFRLEDIKAWSTVVGVPLAGVAPGLLLLLVTALAVDCGRAHLVIHGGPAARAFGAGLRHAIRRPAVLALYLLYLLAWVAISALLLPLGFVGPVVLLFLRQLVALARFWARAIATGGQIASIKGSP